MGRSVSLLIVRAAGIGCAMLALLALLGHAQAQPADDYGLKPLPPGAVVAAPASAPFTPAPAGNVATPAQPQAASSFTPVPANAPPARLVQSPPPRLAGPLDEKPYGYAAGDGLPATALAQPTLPIRVAAVDPRSYAATAPSTDAAYRLGPGDKIRLTVYDETDLSGEFAVDGSGFVRLPLIGQVRAGGLTSQQLEVAIGGALANGYLKSPRVAVEVSTYRPFYIIGAVGRPGEYPYVDHMNVLNAVALAGGYLPSAVDSTVYVRPQGGAQEYKMPADASTVIHPGDVVRVDTTVFWDAATLFSPLNGVASLASLYRQ